ncbi:MAG: hypothetical protein ABIJ10_07495 [Candidatus Micrarchaeota archaeon]
MSKFFKYCAEYWTEHESERMMKVAQILEEEKRLQKEKKKLGLI